MNCQRRQLLVDGYIKEQEQLLKLSNIIPTGIYAIIFEYQLLVEKWNKEYSNSAFTISDDEIVAKIAKASKQITVYGDHVVNYGDSFEWKLKLLNADSCSIVLGLIRCDDEDILKKYQTGYLWYYNNGWALGGTSGWFGFDNGDSRPYCQQYIFNEQGDTVKIRFNWKESSLYFIGDDNIEEAKNAFEVTKNNNKRVKVSDDENAKYRLAVCVLYGSNVEMSVEGEQLQ